DPPEDDAAGAPALRLEQAFRGPHLPHDLRSGQVALEPHHTGQAERACEAAARLRGHAQRDPIVVRHEHRADPASAREREDQLLAAVLRRSHPFGLGNLCDRALGERRAEVLRQGGHPFEVEHGLAVDPRRQLPAAITRGTKLDGEILELGGQESDEVYARHRGKKNITAIPGVLRAPWATSYPPCL